ncbi:MAG: hypothetical protein ACFCVK_00015 [Acidimicrobiales bacterium]
MVLAVVAFGVASCSGSSEPELSAPATTTKPPVPSVPPGPAPAPGAETLDRVAALDGHLAIVDGPTVVVTEPDGDGAIPVDGGGDTVAAQPVWSHDGRRLAWSRAAVTGHALVVHDLADGTELVSDAPGPPTFYLQWSGDDATLASLRNATAGGGIELGVATPGDPIVPVAVTAPFYVSWAPTEAVLAAHVASTEVVLVAGRPGAGIAGGLLVERSGPFTVPAWLDDATVVAVGPEGLARFDVTGGAAQVLGGTTEPIRFVVSPDRTRIAYQLEAPTGGPSAVVLPRGPTAPAQDDPPTTDGGASEGGPADGGQGAGSGLVVLDLATGEQTVVATDPALAWEWSPDGARLAWLAPSPGPFPETVRWQFWDGGAPTSSMPYVPSATVLGAYLPFFEQYAQSHTGWSPDGSAFAFAGRPRVTDDDGIWVQPIGVAGPPVRVADGDAVTWGR